MGPQRRFQRIDNISAGGNEGGRAWRAWDMISNK
jgi:hypothetical protein